MPVTEFAIIPLSHQLTEQNTSLPPPLIEKLRTARSVLQTASKHPFQFFQQIEDSSIIYIIGKWDSTAAHEAFLPSPENQQLLDMLNDDISTDPDKKMSMWHLDDIDVDHVFGPAEREEISVFEAPVITCSRHVVPVNKKEEFGRIIHLMKALLGEVTTPYKAVGGWRIEKESEEKDQYVLFSSADQHMVFDNSKTDGLAYMYRGIVDLVAGFEVKHLRTIEGL